MSKYLFDKFLDILAKNVEISFPLEESNNAKFSGWLNSNLKQMRQTVKNVIVIIG